MAVGGMREVEKVMLHCTRTDTFPTKGSWITSRWSTGFVLLLAKCTLVSRLLSCMPIVCKTIHNPLFNHLTPCAIWLTDVYKKLNVLVCTLYNDLTYHPSGFGGLVVSMLASGTQDRGFAPGQSRRICLAGKIHSMPSFGGELK
jgi:hypothetical protein